MKTFMKIPVIEQDGTRSTIEVMIDEEGEIFLDLEGRLLLKIDTERIPEK